MQSAVGMWLVTFEQTNELNIVIICTLYAQLSVSDVPYHHFYFSRVVLIHWYTHSCKLNFHAHFTDLH